MDCKRLFSNKGAKIAALHPKILISAWRQTGHGEELLVTGGAVHGAGGWQGLVSTGVLWIGSPHNSLHITSITHQLCRECV